MIVYTIPYRYIPNYRISLFLSLFLPLLHWKRLCLDLDLDLCVCVGVGVLCVYRNYYETKI